ncbi:MAG: hypothetical protein IJB97_08325 [Clostridia bacterium]|nr:hypothetical protein [Clostridia bacterium]
MKFNVAKILAVASLVSGIALSAACGGGDSSSSPKDSAIEYDKTVLQTVSEGVTTFDGVSNGQVGMPFGIYGKNSEPKVQDGKVVLSGAQADSMILSLGNTTKGKYTLKFDAEVTGYNALVKIVYDMNVSEEDGAIEWPTTSYANVYKDEGISVSELAKVNGKTHELVFTLGQQFTNFGIVLFNTNEVEGSIALDNISFTKVDYTTKYTFGFEGTKLDFATWAAQPTLKQSASTHVDTSKIVANADNTEERCGTVLETVDGNTYLKTELRTADGSSTFDESITRYCRFNVGWLDAGTYKFTVRVKATGENLNGGFTVTTCEAHPTYPDTNLKDPCVHNKTEYTFTEDWTVFEYTLTIEDARFIKVGVINGVSQTTANCTVYWDDVTVEKIA